MTQNEREQAAGEGTPADLGGRKCSELGAPVDKNHGKTKQTAPDVKPMGQSVTTPWETT